MTGTISRISTDGMSRAEWLRIRKRTIGGSDAAGILGMNSFATPYTVWADKVGLLPDADDNEAMRQGRDLEEYVAQRFCEQTGRKVRRCNAILYNSEYPFAHADVDRLVVGEEAGLECKTTSTLNLKQFKNGEFPDRYYVQCVHYMAVTGLQKWYLAVLVFGRGFYVFEINRDEDEINALMAAEAEFYKRIVANDPPPIDGQTATSEALKDIYDVSADKEADLQDMYLQLLERETLLSRQKALEEEIEKIDNAIKEKMKDAERGTCGEFSVSWKTQTRTSVDTSRIKADLPDIYNKYIKVTYSRPYKIKRQEN